MAGIDKLILGTVQFGLNYGVNNRGGQVCREEAFKILSEARSRGLAYLDTAQSYGTSLEVIGSYLRSQERSEGAFKIFSKFQLKDATGEQIREEVSRQLGVLGVARLKGLSFHSVSEFKTFKDLDVFEQLKGLGWIEQVGVSAYDNDDAIEALSTPGIDIVQIPFNILDNRVRRQTVFETCQRLGKTLHVRSVFLQGLFFMEEDRILAEKPFLKPLLPNLSRLREIARQAGLSIRELALRYALSFDEIQGVLIGVDTREQLLENLDALEGRLDSAVQEELERVRVEATELLSPVNWRPA